MNEALLSSKKMDWCTPKNFFDELNEEFHFTLDVAASDINTKCSKYFTEEDDGLTQDWSGHVVFCNPPYGRYISQWVHKAYIESMKLNTMVVMLISARTDTSYWHEYIFGKAEVRFIRGRLKFTDENGVSSNPAPFPSALVIWKEVGDLSTIEAEPVRHGNWECVNDGENIYMASCCGGELSLESGTPSEHEMIFCPYCGAKMDLE